MCNKNPSGSVVAVDSNTTEDETHVTEDSLPEFLILVNLRDFGLMFVLIMFNICPFFLCSQPNISRLLSVFTYRTGILPPNLRVSSMPHEWSEDLTSILFTVSHVITAAPDDFDLLTYAIE